MNNTKLARAVTEIFAPAVLVTVLLVLLGWHSGWHGVHWAWRGLGFGAVAALFESLLPFLFILSRVRSGRITDHHIGDRRQRLVPLVVGLGSVVVGFLVLSLLGAPRELIAAVVAGFVGLLVAAAINHFWKMSVHAAVVAGSVVICAEVFHGWPLLAAPLVALVGWSRVRLKDHTAGQVLVGAVVGALVAGVTFALVNS
jgi:membrane-associated phospholipid phosphatase